jgi:tRNA threonylcarbamoyl adenosine modification protein (Sua5/YciO/YrdC/YwlC family)
MLLTIHPTHPQPRLLDQVVDVLNDGGVIIYPTDTVYGLGCDIHSRKAIERVARLKGVDPEKANFACICPDLSIVSEYGMNVSTPVYKLMKLALPGPYTFILKASKNVPHYFVSKKKTVGIRVIDHPIPTEIVRRLGRPLLTTSLRDETSHLEYPTNPEAIWERYQRLGVDIVIDGGLGGIEPSTIIDCSEGEDHIRVVREGKGSLSAIGIEVSESR